MYRGRCDYPGPSIQEKGILRHVQKNGRLMAERIFKNVVSLSQVRWSSSC